MHSISIDVHFRVVQSRPTLCHIYWIWLQGNLLKSVACSIHAQWGLNLVSTKANWVSGIQSSVSGTIFMLVMFALCCLNIPWPLRNKVAIKECQLSATRSADIILVSWDFRFTHDFWELQCPTQLQSLHNTMLTDWLVTVFSTQKLEYLPKDT